MSSEVPPATLDWAASAAGRGGRVARIVSMPKASHANHHVAIETAGGVVLDTLLRRYVDAGRLGSDQWYDPICEVEALAVLEPIDLPVPRMIAADITASECDVPTLLLTWLPGHPEEEPADIDDFIDRLARPLPAIHGARPRGGMRAYRPYFESDGIDVADLRPPPWSSDPPLWERAFDAAVAHRPGGPDRFIHRDYHHGNALWEGAALSGIVDWTTGSVGPAGIDVAHMRLNLAWDFSIDVANRFLAAAARAGAVGHDPACDVLDALDWLSDEPPASADEEERYARYEAFVRGALSQLGA